jgi:hypothetical protein
MWRHPTPEKDARGVRIIAGNHPSAAALVFGEVAMGRSRKDTKRGDQYQKMAAGYRILKSPLADTYDAAAELLRESDTPFDHPRDREPDADDGRD